MEDKLKFLQQRRDTIVGGGGPDRIEDQHKK